MHALESGFHFNLYIHYDLNSRNVMVKILRNEAGSDYGNRQTCNPAVNQIWQFERSREKPDDDDVEEKKTYLYIQPEDHMNILPLIIDPGRNFIQVPFANAQDHGYRFEKEAIDEGEKTSFFHCKMNYEKMGVYYNPDFLNRGWDLRVYGISLLRDFFEEFGQGFSSDFSDDLQSDNKDMKAFKIIIMKMSQIGKINSTIMETIREKFKEAKYTRLKSQQVRASDFLDALSASIKQINENGDYLSAYERLWGGLDTPALYLRANLILEYWVWTPFIGVKNLDDEKTKQQQKKIKIPFYEYTSATDILNDDYFQKKFFLKKKPDLSQYTDKRKIVNMAKWVHPVQINEEEEEGQGFLNFTPLECKICKTKDISTLQICSSCNKVAYCSRDCQVKDWLEHKLECI